MAGDVSSHQSRLILKTPRGARSADGCDLEILNFEDLQVHWSVDDYGTALDTASTSTVGIRQGGRGWYRITKFGWWFKFRRRSIDRPDRVPDASGVNHCRGQQLEIDEHHHRHLLDEDLLTRSRMRGPTIAAAPTCSGRVPSHTCDQAKAEREKQHIPDASGTAATNRVDRQMLREFYHRWT